MNKILKDQKLAELIIKFKKEKKITALLHGVFDVLHIGHIKYFEDIKRYCDVIIVSVTDDPFVNKGPGRPLFNIEERMKMISSIESVNFVTISKSETAEKIIKTIKPDLFVKGKDYKNKKNDLSKNINKEIKAIKSVGGKFLTTESPLHSSSKIINEETNILSEDLKKFLKIIDKEKIRKNYFSLLENINNKKILIIGEPIIDVYNYVKIQGKSSKNNILSSKHISTDEFGGGTFLVANTIAEYASNIDFLTFYNQYNKKYIKKFLSNKNINLKIIKDNKIKFLIKKRFIDQYSNNRLYQINYNDETSLNKEAGRKINNYLKKNHKKYDYIVAFDFGHNYFSAEVVNILNKLHKKTFINCQSNSSNFGYNLINKYKKALTIAMDEQEFRLSVQDKNTDVKNLIKSNRKLINKFKNFVITMGKFGCYHSSNGLVNFIPAIYSTFKDTTGSGDVFFSIYISLKITNKFSDKEACLISHLAAGLHANYIGNEKKFNKKTLYKALDLILK
jgi:rfaE bifunctional protein nucleotidyltransferase chain/domain